MKWVSMAEQLHTSLDHCVQCQLEWCKSHCHWTLEQQKRVLWNEQIKLHYLVVRRTNLSLQIARSTILPTRLHSTYGKV